MHGRLTEEASACRRVRSPTWIVTALIALAAATVGCRSSTLANSVEQTHVGPAIEPAAANDYDPWEPFNERMFWFNHDVLDRLLVKPVAKGWEKVVPGPARRSIGRAFDNLDMPHRLVNNLFQARLRGAGQELARFLLNTTVGVVGLLDVAKPLGIEPSDADTGQTLGIYGVGPGPYLVLPFLPPLTVRDGIGYGVDGAMDPIGYFLPFAANGARSLVNTINSRSLNLEIFDDVEDSVLDLYSAVRNGYLQRRSRAVEQRRCGGKRSAQTLVTDWP